MHFLITTTFYKFHSRLHRSLSKDKTADPLSPRSPSRILHLFSLTLNTTFLHLKINLVQYRMFTWTLNYRLSKFASLSSCISLNLTMAFQPEVVFRFITYIWLQISDQRVPYKSTIPTNNICRRAPPCHHVFAITEH